MKILETIHLILVAALVIGVPVAASTHPDGQPFSLLTSLKQAAIAAGIILILIACNFSLARIASRAEQRKK